MKLEIPLYLLTMALLAVSVYLKSPVIAVSIVALWGVKASEIVLSRKNRDEDITELMSTIAAHKNRMASLERDVVNVAERARTILGENF